MYRWLLAYLFFLLLYFNSGAQLPVFKKIESVPDGVDAINDIALGKDSALWIATNRGLLKFKDDNMTRIYDPDNPNIYAINTLFIDENNTKWFGTYTSSIVKFFTKDSLKQISFSEFTGEKFTLVSGIAKEDNTLWGATASGKLFSYDLEENIKEEERTPDCKSIYSIKIHHKNGKKWLATSSGLYKRTIFGFWKKIPYFNISYGIFRSNDEYWAIGRNKKNRISLIYYLRYYLNVIGIDIPQYKWKTMILDGLGNPYVKFNDIDIDSNRKIWFATNNGIIRYNAQAGYALPIREDKYPKFKIEQANNILVQRDDCIWVSSFGRTLYKIKLK